MSQAQKFSSKNDRSCTCTTYKTEDIHASSCLPLGKLNPVQQKNPTMVNLYFRQLCIYKEKGLEKYCSHPVRYGEKFCDDHLYHLSLPMRSLAKILRQVRGNKQEESLIRMFEDVKSRSSSCSCTTYKTEKIHAPECLPVTALSPNQRKDQSIVKLYLKQRCIYKFKRSNAPRGHCCNKPVKYGLTLCPFHLKIKNKIKMKNKIKKGALPVSIVTTDKVDIGVNKDQNDNVSASCYKCSIRFIASNNYCTICNSILCDICWSEVHSFFPLSEHHKTEPSHICRMNLFCVDDKCDKLEKACCAECIGQGQHAYHNCEHIDILAQRLSSKILNNIKYIDPLLTMLKLVPGDETCDGDILLSQMTLYTEQRAMLNASTVIYARGLIDKFNVFFENAIDVLGKRF